MQVINNPHKIIILQKLREIVWIVSVVLLTVGCILQNVVAAEKEAVLRVAVASNFLLPIKQVKKEFEKQTQIKLKISAASTAKLYAQIINGAPFDVFLAADVLTPQKIAEQGLGQESGAFQYAQGQLVLWAPKPKNESVDVLKKRFLSGDFFRLALANPKTAPYGRAAEQVLDYYSVNMAHAKRILGESVGQAYQFTASGNVDMGFVALSQLQAQLQAQSPLSKQQQRYWLVPVEAYQPIAQHGIILKKAQQSAELFMCYLKSPQVQAMLREEFGYL